jgi:RecB family endonuclease NucS
VTEQIDRREALDRWSKRHDDAVAFMLFGAGQEVMRALLPTPSAEEHLAKGVIAKDPELLSIWMTTEYKTQAGYIDAIYGASWSVQAFNGDPKTVTCMTVCEVKTGEVIAGEVIRQLTKYRDALLATVRQNGIGEKPKVKMLLAHVRPIAPSAKKLLDWVGISVFWIDLPTSQVEASPDEKVTP